MDLKRLFRRNIVEVEVKDTKVELKKGYFGYRVVHPIINDNGKLNWINFIFGGWENLIILLIVLLFIFYAINSYRQDIQTCKEIIERDSAIYIKEGDKITYLNKIDSPYGNLYNPEYLVPPNY